VSRILRACLILLAFLLLLRIDSSDGTSSKNGQLPLRTERSSPWDLEISGDWQGQAPGTRRYLRREDLFALPQVSFTVKDDPNFDSPTAVRGIDLEALVRALAVDIDRSIIVAVCNDWYRAYYPRRYREIHKPVLALELNGKQPSDWAKRRDGFSMGPYLITHEHFVPTARILSQQEVAQIPWGVVRLEFWKEETLLASIKPHGPAAADPTVQSGYGVARQNCLRCHGPESEGPWKGKLSWEGIAFFASQSPKNFAAYVRDPQSQAKDAQMPGNPDFDYATLQALIAYFQTFQSAAKPSSIERRETSRVRNSSPF